jgi:carbonic anhydrase
VCASGKNQSPIDLKEICRGGLEAAQLEYKTGVADIINNGHTVQVNYAPGSSLAVDGLSFELKQFHFHSPTENKVNGKQFPLEGHLVHADKGGNIAVVAVLFQEGAANTLLTKLWERMPNRAARRARFLPA